MTFGRKPRFAGVAEAAELLKISKPALADRRRLSDDFPPPIAELACGPIWEVSDLRAYQRAYDRRLWARLEQEAARRGRRAR